MKPFFLALFLFTGALLVSAGVVWDAVIYCDNWENILSPYQKFMLYWKPTLFVIVGGLLFVIGNETFNKK